MKSLFAKTVLVLLPVVAFSSQSFACQEISSASEQQEIQMNGKDLTAKNPTLHNLRSGLCQAVASAHTDGAVMDFIPVDEEWLGLYEEYRNKGEAPLQALRHAYNFMAGSHA